MVRKALNEHEKRLLRLVDKRCKKMVHDLSQKLQERALDNVYTPIHGVMEQAAGKALLNQGADELLEEENYKLAESQHFEEDPFRSATKF